MDHRESLGSGHGLEFILEEFERKKMPDFVVDDYRRAKILFID